MAKFRVGDLITDGKDLKLITGEFLNRSFSKPGAYETQCLGMEPFGNGWLRKYTAHKYYRLATRAERLIYG